MDINIISDTSFSVYITKNELIGRGLSPADVEPEEAKRLVETALGRSLGSASVELFSGGGDLMVFVRREAGACRFYRFPEAEALIAAACAADAAPSEIFLMDGAYILSVPEDGLVSPMDDFGERLSAPPEYREHLAEHGRVLIAENALSRLRALFLT